MVSFKSVVVVRDDPSGDSSAAETAPAATSANTTATKRSKLVFLVMFSPPLIFSTL
ncbi:hypothetical protein [Methanobacterium sp.]|uniref:hypothetical protein n=1 Tax=Methanobacterium sp. TaxID=2164 RepID=UPI002AB8C3B6|nr:hypothetical protein [Methanobacterium sp.]MDY9923597.1 hypothetical protein [Methanobacterium sp.]